MLAQHKRFFLLCNSQKCFLRIPESTFNVSRSLFKNGYGSTTLFYTKVVEAWSWQDISVNISVCFCLWEVIQAVSVTYSLSLSYCILLPWLACLYSACLCSMISSFPALSLSLSIGNLLAFWAVSFSFSLFLHPWTVTLQPFHSFYRLFCGQKSWAVIAGVSYVSVAHTIRLSHNCFHETCFSGVC